MGLAFAFGWTPCIGPVLATVLTLAANEISLGMGVKLLFVYSLGLGMPFILAAVAIRPFLGFMKRFRRHLGKMEKIWALAAGADGHVVPHRLHQLVRQWMLDTFPACEQASSRW